MSKAMFMVKMLLLSCLLAASQFAWSSEEAPSVHAPAPAQASQGMAPRHDMRDGAERGLLASGAEGLAGDHCCMNSACSPLGCCAVTAACIQDMGCVVVTPQPVTIHVSVTQIFLSFDTRPPIASA